MTKYKQGIRLGGMIWELSVIDTHWWTTSAFRHFSGNKTYCPSRWKWIFMSTDKVLELISFGLGRAQWKSVFNPFCVTCITFTNCELVNRWWFCGFRLFFRKIPPLNSKPKQNDLLHSLHEMYYVLKPRLFASCGGYCNNIPLGKSEPIIMINYNYGFVRASLYEGVSHTKKLFPFFPRPTKPSCVGAVWCPVIYPIMRPLFTYKSCGVELFW